MRAARLWFIFCFRGGGAYCGCLLYTVFTVGTVDVVAFSVVGLR